MQNWLIIFTIINKCFINYTGEQLGATSKMTWQSQQALDWLLAENVGVCLMFGDQFCTYISNNTAPEGSFTEAMTKLKNLRQEITDNAGSDMHSWGWFESTFGQWGNVNNDNNSNSCWWIVVLLCSAHSQITCDSCYCWINVTTNCNVQKWWVSGVRCAKKGPMWCLTWPLICLRRKKPVPQMRMKKSDEPCHESKC